MDRFPEATPPSQQTGRPSGCPASEAGNPSPCSARREKNAGAQDFLAYEGATPLGYSQNHRSTKPLLLSISKTPKYGAGAWRRERRKEMKKGGLAKAPFLLSGRSPG